MITGFVALSDHRMHFCLGKAEGDFPRCLFDVPLITDLFELAHGTCSPSPNSCVKEMIAFSLPPLIVPLCL